MYQLDNTCPSPEAQKPASLEGCPSSSHLTPLCCQLCAPGLAPRREETLAPRSTGQEQQLYCPGSTPHPEGTGATRCGGGEHFWAAPCTLLRSAWEASPPTPPAAAMTLTMPSCTGLFSVSDSLSHFLFPPP